MSAFESVEAQWQVSDSTGRISSKLTENDSAFAAIQAFGRSGPQLGEYLPLGDTERAGAVFLMLVMGA